MNHSNANLLGVISPLSKQEYSEAIILRQTIEMATKVNWREVNPVDEAQYEPSRGINIAQANANFANKPIAGNVITKMFEKQKRFRRN